MLAGRRPCRVHWARMNSRIRGNGGEAYARDEINALVQFAHGVGTGLDNLGSSRAESTSLAALSRKIDDLSAKLSGAAT